VSGGRQPIADRVAAVGVGQTANGLLPGRGVYDLGIEALKAALADAGLGKDDLDGVLTRGLAPLQLAQVAGLAPRVTASLDYSAGGFTLEYAAMLIASGVCDTVACLHAHAPATRLDQLAGPIVYDPAQGLVNPATGAAMGWTEHRHRHGPYDDEALGHVVLAARRHAQRNPEAIFRDALTMDEYLEQPVVLSPFRALDIGKLSNGAWCVILRRADLADEALHPRVVLRAIGRRQSPDPLRPGHLLLDAMRSAADQVYAAAGCGPEDIDVLTLSDGHSAVVLMTLEQYGFCGFGESADFVAAGETDLGGRLPLNPDGGQLSCAYSIGFLHQIELIRQLRGECGPRQVEGARLGQYCTTGGFRQHFATHVLARA
jgi:acetyl-CoA acetyltransferase